ncbi:MAG: AAA family ATPase [Chloroflexi bacterium]|nr:AAA family ATPase [Chloroflexota bacterium]
MTTQPAPVPRGYISPDELSPEDRACLERLGSALRCGVPGCSCANPARFHCPSHDNAEVPTLSVTYGATGLAFQCTRCPNHRVMDALAKRGLLPDTHFYTAAGALEAGLQPFEFLIQQPPDWLWPNRIPLGKLTLIAGYPSSGKTSVALDIAARVSRGAAAPDQPDARFPSASVVLAILNGNPRSDVLPTLRLFGADLARIYLADLLSPDHLVDYYPNEPPEPDGPDYEDDEDEDAYEEDDDDDLDDLLDGPVDRAAKRRRRRSIGMKFPVPRWNDTPPAASPDLIAPWPNLRKVMKRLANYIEEGHAVLLVVDQVEDLAAMHRAQVATVLGMLNAVAVRTGAAVVALGHNPAPNYPRAVTAMQRRLAQASVVFTTAVVEPGGRRFLVPLRPAMSDDAPAIPFVLPPSPSSSFLRRQEPRSLAPGSPSSATAASPAAPPSSGTPASPVIPASSVIPVKTGIQSPPPSAFTVAWRKPVFPAHLHALATRRPNDGAKVRAARAFLIRALAGGPVPAAAVEREAARLGISRTSLHRARTACGVRASRINTPGVPRGNGAWYWSLPARNTLQQDETPPAAEEVVNR